jgi:alpha-glucosidase (family GH31 glycosyl hydrolase)
MPVTSLINIMKIFWTITAVLFFGIPAFGQGSTDIRYGKRKAELMISQVSDLTLEIKLSPIADNGNTVASPASDVLIDYHRKMLWQGRSISGGEMTLKAGELTVRVRASPLSVSIENGKGKVVQEFAWRDNETWATSFKTPAAVYGLGEGGRSDHLDRRGFLHPMRDGNASYELATHGAYIAAPMLIGIDGWSLFFHQPINRGNAIDLRNGEGKFLPVAEALEQPLKLLITCWKKPADIFTEYRTIAGVTPMPPLWSLGYMQSHRTLTGPDEIFWVAHNFRERNLPVDAVIYLGTGFTPTGWNNGHDSFDFNAKIFTDPAGIINGLKDMDFKVILHNYSPPRNLHGASINGSRPTDTSDINHFWERHRKVNSMISGWWPDGGEGLSAESRIARHKMYFQGPLHDKPNTRPWSLHRTGYNGAHRYGGWIWSGDPSSTWKTLETHIGVGLNHSASLSPFWGTDIAGFVPTNELTGELYIRWLQFAAFTASFRGHGRTWHLRLPWGWNQGTVGPPESSIFDSENRNAINNGKGYPYPGELRNALIEPIARQYLNLRYQLLPYNYGLARETHDSGLPPMRAMWMQYPDDSNVTNLGDQFLWGADLLVAPVYEKGQASRKLYLPKGDWYDFWTNEKLEGGRPVSRQVDLGTMPLYVREGAIIPFDPVRQYTSQKVTGNTTLKIYSGANGSYTLYEDDGSTGDYLKGAFTQILITWDESKRTVTLKPVHQNGRKTISRKFIIELLPEGLFKSVEYKGKEVYVKF